MADKLALENALALWHGACLQPSTVSSATRRPARRRRGRRDRVAVVVPSEGLRRNLVAQLTALGYEARGTGSFDEVRALVEANAIDTLILHVSAFSTTVLTQLGRAMRGRRSITLIASVSVVTVPEVDRDQASRRKNERTAPGGSPWRVATYWLPFSRLSEFSTGLRGPNLN